ncbi:MAG: hypothetical protein DRP54_02285 [Spirochaetes bacterium]|nr:MAG: hypothetical protein DRP54_02285 [Spirochaetota bacterium]
MGKILNPESFWEQVFQANTIVLTTHVRPDGDGIASELALSMLLEKKGKKTLIVNQDPTPEIYGWLPGADGIVFGKINPSGLFNNVEKFDLLLLVDCSGQDRIGEVTTLVQNALEVASIDHHKKSDCFRDWCMINPEASSIGEMIWETYPNITHYTDEKIALCLYVSIMTDTGSFSYPNTTSKVLRFAADLMEMGVNANQVFQMIYSNRSMRHFRLLSKALNLLQTDTTGKIGYVLLPESVYVETGALEEDNEGLLEVLRGLKNVEIIILLRQLKDGMVKASLRSKNNIDCSDIAVNFGGGGHMRASGFVVKGRVEEIGVAIVNKIIDLIKKKGYIL